MKISKQGIDFIKRWEGFKAVAYLDSAGVDTIGYGTTRYADKRPVRVNDRITEPLAEQLLIAHLARGVEPRLNSLLNGIPITQQQYDALCDFCYNLGAEAFASSTLYAIVMRHPHNDPAISNAFMMWNKIRKGGQLIALEGLTNRRRAESLLYFKNIYND